MAGRLQAPIFTHVREGKAMAIQQAISDAVLTDAPLHIVHMNSMTLEEIGLAIEMVNTAQQKGYDITTEVYPYTAASTGIESAIFDEGWQERLGISYGDIQWVETGERLTEETFKIKRETGGTVIIHMMKPEWIEKGITSDNVIIASDGMYYAELAHPRTAGTYSRVLGKYVREDQVLDLPTALKKMTLLPAQVMEKISPMMRFKGRIQVGADADLTIFDPLTVIDRATFDKGLKFSDGIRYVLVNGVLVLKEGNTVKDVFPGQPIYGKYKR
jgi:dihydroorotase